MSIVGVRNVSCPIFDGHEYPQWKAMMKKRLMVMNIKLWTVTEIGLTDLCKMAEADDIREYTYSTSHRRMSSTPVCPKISSGTSCISIMRS